MTTTSIATPPTAKNISGEPVGRRVNGIGAVIEYLTVFRKRPMSFVVLCLLLAALVLMLEARDEELALNDRASLSVLQLRAETAHEAGPQYVWALAVHSDLLDRAIADLAMRKRGGLMARWFGGDIDYEALLKDAREDLSVNTTNEDEARAAIVRATDALEKVSSQLETSSRKNVQDETRYSYCLTSTQKEEMLKSFLYDHGKFVEEARRFLDAPNPSSAEHACMQSRITAFSARLGWPEIGLMPEGLEKLHEFLEVLSKVRAATDSLAETLAGADGNESAESHRLRQFALSQQQRLDTWRARLNKDGGAVKQLLVAGRK